MNKFVNIPIKTIDNIINNHDIDIEETKNNDYA